MNLYKGADGVIKCMIYFLPFKNSTNSQFGRTSSPGGFGYGIVGLHKGESDPQLEITGHGWSGSPGSHCTLVTHGLSSPSCPKPPSINRKQNRMIPALPSTQDYYECQIK